MAFSGATPAQLSSLLECEICLDTYHHPKQLCCGHTYCQHCLDGLATFNEDGSAEIRCPLRCSIETKLDPHKTSSTLNTAYIVNRMLSELSNVEKVNSQCQQSKECRQIVSRSCTTCGAKICKKCKNIHSCINKSFTNVTFNEKLQEMQPLCEEHNSPGRFACIHCDNTFTCVYCIHRNHKNHERKSIAEFGEEARKWFQSFIGSFEETKVILENLTEEYGESLKDLKSSREAFVRELKVRKLKRIEDYLKMLNTEEENLLLKFDQMMEEFKSNILSSGLTLNTRAQEFSKYIKEFNLKCNFEIVAEKWEIERKLRSLSSLPRVIPSYNMHLKSLNKPDCVTNLLGELKISVGDVNVAEPYKCYVYKSTIEQTERLSSHAQLDANLKTLLEEIKGYKESIENRGCWEEPMRDVKPKRVLLDTKSYTFEELEKMIKDEDIEKLNTILINNPNIVTMRNIYQSTLLIIAASRNKPAIVKVLIDAGSDVYAVNKCNTNAYHYSARYGYHDVLKLLINHDVTKINNGDCRNSTALHLASSRCHVECVKLLLSIPGIDVNKQNCDNETPLHLASLYGHIECVKLLLSIPGIDVNIRNCVKNTAYDVADNGAIKRLFKEHQK